MRGLTYEEFIQMSKWVQYHIYYHPALEDIPVIMTDSHRPQEYVSMDVVDRLVEENIVRLIQQE